MPEEPIPDIEKRREVAALAKEILHFVCCEQSRSDEAVKIDSVFEQNTHKDLLTIRKALDLLIRARRIGISAMRPFDRSWVWWTDDRPADPPHGPLDIDEM